MKLLSENSLKLYLRFVSALLISLLLFCVFNISPVLSNMGPQPVLISLMLVVVFLSSAMIFCWNKSLQKLDDLFFIYLLLALLVLIRGCLLYYQSGDYNSFLVHWIEALRTAPGASGLSTRVGDYNMPYLYFMFLIAKLGNPSLDLFLTKFVSMMFDVLLAYYFMKLVSLKTSSPRFQACSFLMAFAIPTVILNSSMWAQCDSIYTAFALGAIYYALREDSKRAYIFLGIAFSFKMQTVFIFPLFLVFLVMRKIRLRDAYLFVLVFFLFLVPALVAGMPLTDALSVYLEQTAAYPHMTANAINLYQLILNVEFVYFNLVAIVLAGLAVLALLYFIYSHRNQINSLHDYVYIAFLFAVIIPFLLPRMHDRYFFIADVLSVLLFFYNKKRFFVPVVVVFCSYVTYAKFLMGFQALFEFKYLAVLLLFVILIVLKDFVSKLYLNQPRY